MLPVNFKYWKEQKEQRMLEEELREKKWTERPDGQQRFSIKTKI